MGLKLPNRKVFAALLFALLFVGASLPILSYGESIESGTEVVLNLRIVPTSLVLTPGTMSIDENDDPRPFTLMAYYDYPLAPEPILPKDVTADPLTEWSSSNDAIAMVNTIGVLTPVSDFDTTAISVLISGTYGGVTATSTVTVTGTLPPPPPPVPPTPEPSRGGGGSPRDWGVPVPPTATPTVPPTPPATVPEGTPVPPRTPSLQDYVAPPVTGGQANRVPIKEYPRVILGQEYSPYLPLEKPVNPSEIVAKPKPSVGPAPSTEVRVTRAYVAEAVVDKMNVLGFRKSLLDRCYADLENCTNIFRMNSSYSGIKLDLKDLKLFPDVNNTLQKDKINKLALLGILNGYYGIKTSPFLPNKSISRVETLKILTTILMNLQKGSPDYALSGFDYGSLFYQEVYVAYLSLNKAKFASNLFVKIAHAFEGEAWNLIKSQKTLFADIRPDLYEAHWYYPIVYNKLCDLKLISCVPGAMAYPDISPSAAEVGKYIDLFNKYIDAHHLGEDSGLDSDKDGLLNIDENVVYMTSPKVADTDGDKLGDGDEINRYKTNPNVVDTDQDGLSDVDEVRKYKTDPNKFDTDGDGFADAEEVKERSDPLKASSKPEDINNNHVSDKWESGYNVRIKNGSQDTDGDGVSDVLEYRYGTDPTRVDSDMDGYTDSEEILDMSSNPIDANDPGELSDYPVMISNFQYGQLVTESMPLIKGMAKSSHGDSQVKVQILLRNEFGSELKLGEAVTDAKGKFLFIPEINIKNGTYLLVAREIDKRQVRLSDPIKIVIDLNSKVAQAKLAKLGSTSINDDVLVSGLVLKVDAKDGRPVLSGTLSEFGSKVNVTWQSMVMSSVLMVDTTDGFFSVKAPYLAPGRHTVYVQTVRKRDNALSQTLSISFDLSLSPSKELPGGENVLAANAPGTVIGGALWWQNWLIWAGGALLAVLMTIWICWLILRRRKDK